MLNRLYDLLECASFLGCHPDTLRRHIKRGNIEAVKIKEGGRTKYLVSPEGLAILERKLKEVA